MAEFWKLKFWSDSGFLPVAKSQNFKMMNIYGAYFFFIRHKHYTNYNAMEILEAVLQCPETGNIKNSTFSEILENSNEQMGWQYS